MTTRRHAVFGGLHDERVSRCCALHQSGDVEIHDGTKKATWQSLYRATFDDELLGGSIGDELSPEERLTQDSMTRATLKRALPEIQWQALAGKYSINQDEVRAAAAYLTPRVVSPAHQLFKTKCVMAWMIPERRNGLPASFYVLHSWDADGTPERTLRRWRSITKQWLDDQVAAAHFAVEALLDERGLLHQDAA